MAQKLPTAEEFIQEYWDTNSDFIENIREQMSKMSGIDFNNIPDLMIAFAKIHLEAFAKDNNIPSVKVKVWLQNNLNT